MIDILYYGSAIVAGLVTVGLFIVFDAWRNHKAHQDFTNIIEKMQQPVHRWDESGAPMNLEAMATVEHKQWAHWTTYMLNNLTDENIERWRQQIHTPYANLTEAEKESDREWARRAILASGVMADLSPGDHN